MPAYAGPSHLAEASSPSDSINGHLRGWPQQHKISADQQLSDDSQAGTARQAADLEQGPLEWLSVGEPELYVTSHAQPAQEQPGLDESTFSKPRPYTAAVLRIRSGGAASKVPDHAEHHQLLSLPVRTGPGRAISRELKAGRALSWPNIDVSILLRCLLYKWAVFSFLQRTAFTHHQCQAKSLCGIIDQCHQDQGCSSKSSVSIVCRTQQQTAAEIPLRACHLSTRSSL